MTFTTIFIFDILKHCEVLTNELENTVDEIINTLEARVTFLSLYSMLSSISNNMTFGLRLLMSNAV